MKFEANIPSYLRTGQGVFPVRGKSATKVEKETNFFKLMEKGVNMPVSNEIKGSESALLGSPGMNEPMSEGNFLEKMQNKMAAVPADERSGAGAEHRTESAESACRARDRTKSRSSPGQRLLPAPDPAAQQNCS